LKKTIYILFALTFTVITLGFIVNKHYSGGKLFSVAFFGEPDSCCEGTCECCDEETVIVQFHADYTFSTETFEPTLIEVEPLVLTLSLDVLQPELLVVETKFFDQDLPPPDNLSRLSFKQAFLL